MLSGPMRRVAADVADGCRADTRRSQDLGAWAVRQAVSEVLVKCVQPLLPLDGPGAQQ